jgi:hypothetical protein
LKGSYEVMPTIEREDARPLAFRRMQTFRAVPERGRNLEAVPMTLNRIKGLVLVRK